MAKTGAAPPAAEQSVKHWLEEHGKSQQWLANQINALRAEQGVPQQIGRGTLWRWMSGTNLINVDDALRIRSITGTPVHLWSRYDLGPSSTPSPVPVAHSSAA
jgi:hypothetical protein